MRGFARIWMAALQSVPDVHSASSLEGTCSQFLPFVVSNRTNLLLLKDTGCLILCFQWEQQHALNMEIIPIIWFLPADTRLRSCLSALESSGKKWVIAQTHAEKDVQLQ